MDGNDLAYLEHYEFINDGTDDLLESLVLKNYFLEFQPICTLQDLQIIGFEALIRLASVKGPIPAQAFVPIAERNGAMDPIGFWALEETALVAQTFKKLYGTKAPFISVNISAVQLELDNFKEKFIQACAPYDFEADKMVIDIDQQVFLSRRAPLMEKVAFLKERGHPIHMDGFNPRSLEARTLWSYDLVKAVKWPLEQISRWPNAPRQKDIFTEALAFLDNLAIQVIFHKIDHATLLKILQETYPRQKGQGFVMGLPMGLENSLKIYQRQRERSLRR